MPDIKLLNKQIYDLIAAGEVITNPFCVVKELVENSIDANSDKILIEIKNGGKSLIRVIDNGDGIKNKQCKLAFYAHATSKISNESDLYKIKTLGFRGEALYSIAKVSKLLIVTKNKNEKLGSRYYLEAGEEKSFNLIEASNGTTIEVKDIFFNLPARLKFLKKDVKEANLIEDIVTKLALSNSLISFELKKDGKTVLQTFKSKNLTDIIYNIYGREFYENLLEINFQNEYVKIDGVCGNPSYAKSYRKIQHLFVNSRYVKNKFCVDAVENAFKGLIAAGKYPSFVINLTVPTENLDVNIHPNKIKVRFNNEKEIFNFLSFAISQAIFKYNNFSMDKDLKNYDFIKKDEESSFELKSNVEPYKFEEKDILKDFKYLSSAKIKKNTYDENFKFKKKLTKEQENLINNIVEEKLEKEKEKKELKFNTNKIRVIGEIFKLYILAEFKDEFIVIDKHAAHEKIIYKKLKNESLNDLERQILINPLKYSLASSEETDIILNSETIFLKFGFLIEHFQGNQILIREIPTILNGTDFEEVFEQILMNIKKNRKDLTPEKIDNIYATIACKSAIKANEINSFSELEVLTEKVYFDDEIRNCPHSRPVVFIFKKERFDKKFGRK